VPIRAARRLALNLLVRSFLQGCLVIVPVVVTGYVVYVVLARADRLIGAPIPGLGVLLCVAAITITGAVFSNVVGRGLLRFAERVIARVPLVRLLYTTLRDLVGAFVGEERGFDRPVVVSLGEGEDLLGLGFITQDDLSGLGLPGYAAVYFPQAYNIAGHTLAVPTSRVRPLDVSPARVMALIVSGGITTGSKT
jgi:uncharacterized membrane protein